MWDERLRDLLVWEQTFYQVILQCSGLYKATLEQMPNNFFFNLRYGLTRRANSSNLGSKHEE